MADLSLSPSRTSRTLGEKVADDSPSPPLRRVVLQGKETALVPLDALRHGAALYSISHGTPEKESVWAYLGYGPFETLEAMGGFLEECQRSDDPRFFAVTEPSHGRAVGVVSFLRFDRPSRCIELGHIWYGVSHHRRRTNTEAVYLLLREAFDHLHCRRVEWKCDARNRRSWKAAERLGFQFEGLFRQHRIVKGRNRDTAWFSMLDTEWPRVRRALERWLDWGKGKPPSLASLREKSTIRRAGSVGSPTPLGARR